MGEMTMQNDGNRKGQYIYVQDQTLFGHNDWIPIQQKGKYSVFPYFGHTFVENLMLNEEKNAIELMKPSEIDTIYHSDIVGAQFFVSYDALNKTIIKSEEEKKDFMGKAEKYSFAEI